MIFLDLRQAGQPNNRTAHHRPNHSGELDHVANQSEKASFRPTVEGLEPATRRIYGKMFLKKCWFLVLDAQKIIKMMKIKKGKALGKAYIDRTICVWYVWYVYTYILTFDMYEFIQFFFQSNWQLNPNGPCNVWRSFHKCEHISYQLRHPR